MTSHTNLIKEKDPDELRTVPVLNQNRKRPKNFGRPKEGSTENNLSESGYFSWYRRLEDLNKVGN